MPETVPLPLVAVELRCNVEGATLRVDGTPSGVFPLPGPIVLTHGEHVFVVQKNGYSSMRYDVVVSPDEKKKFNLKLSPLDTEPLGSAGPCLGVTCADVFPDAPYCIVDEGEATCAECILSRHCGEGGKCIDNECTYMNIPSGLVSKADTITTAVIGLYGIGTAASIGTLVSLIAWAAHSSYSSSWREDKSSMAFTFMALGSLVIQDVATILALAIHATTTDVAGLAPDTLLVRMGATLLVMSNLILPASIALSIAGWSSGEGWPHDSYMGRTRAALGIVPSFGLTGMLFLFGSMAIVAPLNEITRNILETGSYAGRFYPWMAPIQTGMAGGFGGRF
jgi:hypothetical protein